jgi:hypothetical protein
MAICGMGIAIAGVDEDAIGAAAGMEGAMEVMGSFGKMRGRAGGGNDARVGEAGGDVGRGKSAG